VAIDGKVEGVVAIADEIKGTAQRAIDALHRLGLRTVMLTGDNERAAATVAAAVGVDEYHAGVQPEDKLGLVRDLQAAGSSVAMVGDGMNDAPALAQADIGIAMSTGTDVAIEAADITLLHGDISKVAEAISLSREMLTTIRQNLFWAFGYNVVAIPIAALGLLNPIIAGAAMAFSSVSVMSNSLRLRSKAKRIARKAGNDYRPSGSSFAAVGAPALAMVAAVVILVVPLLVFMAIDRGWFNRHEGTVLGPRDVHVTLSNFEIALSSDEIAAGEVHLLVEHEDEGDHGGPGATHDVIVLHRASGGREQVVARSEALEGGDSEWLSVDLPAGEYEFFCSVVEEVRGHTVSHQAEGMTTTFHVTSTRVSEGEATRR
jgi:soluble P-type ATPase